MWVISLFKPFLPGEETPAVPSHRYSFKETQSTWSLYISYVCLSHSVLRADISIVITMFALITDATICTFHLSCTIMQLTSRLYHHTIYTPRFRENWTPALHLSCKIWWSYLCKFKNQEYWRICFLEFAFNFYLHAIKPFCNTRTILLL